jgi:hypothetical protein
LPVVLLVAVVVALALVVVLVPALTLVVVVVTFVWLTTGRVFCSGARYNGPF